MGTEDVDPRYADLDLWPTATVVDAILQAQLAAVAAVQAVRGPLAQAAAAAAHVLAEGRGRLVYAGAGTSGRLAVQDGVELLPTYGWPGDRLLTFMAGGEAALLRSVEGAEDDAAAVEAALAHHGVGPGDVVIAVAASGRTPYAVAAAATGRRRGALVIGLANVSPSPLLAAADHPLALETGAEVVAGSTRMAAGTAQKAALTTLSTAIMVALGGTYSNLMVGLAARNAKLDRRRVAILRHIVPLDPAAAVAVLAAAGGDLRVAALMAKGDDGTTARARLVRHGGSLRRALAERARESDGRDGWPSSP